MKIKILFVFLAACNSYLFAQNNVGIGTTTPVEKLDVNGNINVQGTIKVNGIAGQNNQVLMTNASGNLAWVDLNQYKNFIGFPEAGLGQTWIIPTGVTKILVEAWGGGAGGNMNGGGGGGGYIQAIFTVVPGQTVNINVADYSSPATFGDITSVTIASDGAYAHGGGASFSQPGFGGLFHANVPNFGFSGEAGHITTEKYEQYGSSNFLKAIYYGNGGSGGNTINTGGRGSYTAADLTTPFPPIKTYNGITGMVPGGGGGASSGGGYGGGKGMVIIRY